MHPRGGSVSDKRSDPDSELQTNLSYCTAIAWLLQRRAGGFLEPSDTPSLASA